MLKNKSTATIFFIVFLDLFGFGIILPLLPYIAEQFQANALTIGLLSSTYSFFQLIAAPILGKLSDRYGRKKLLAISQFGSAVGFVLLGLAHSLPLLFLSRIIDGITGGNISIAQAYMADITDKESRAKGMGLLGAAFGLGFILGPAVGGVLSNFGFAAPAFVAAVMAGLTSLATIFFLKETVNTKKASRSHKTELSLAGVLEILKIEPLGLLVVIFFLISLSFSGLQATFALWAQESFGYGPSEIGWIFAMIGVIGIITQVLLLPRLIKRLGERKLLALGVLSLGIGLLLHPIVIVPWMLVFTTSFLAFGNGVSNPTLQAIASENVSPVMYGAALGVMHSSASLGRVFGPIIGGELFDIFGHNAPYLVSGLIMLGVFWIILRFLPRERKTIWQRFAGIFRQ